MAIAGHRDRKGHNVVRVDNMRHVLGDQWVLQLGATSFRQIIAQSHRNRKVSHELQSLQSQNIGIWEFPYKSCRTNSPVQWLIKTI